MSQDDTPEPTSKDVFVHSTPSFTVYVSQYSGFGVDDITISRKVLQFHSTPIILSVHILCRWLKLAAYNGHHFSVMCDR